MNIISGQGFRPRTGVDVSRTFQAKACIVFCPCAPITQLESLTISLTDTNQLRLIGNISSTEETCLQTALTQWPHGCKSMEYTDELGPMDQTEKCYLVKFNKDPWIGILNENESIHGKLTLQSLINELKQLGWSLLISTDISSKYDANDNFSIDCHSLFLVKTSNEYFNEEMRLDTPAPPSYLQTNTGSVTN